MIVPKSRTLASGGGGWPAEVSTDPAPVQLFSKHPAKISIKLPEVLRCPHRRHNRDREGSQLVEVTALCKEPLRSQRKAVFSEHNQEAFGFYCLLYQGGTQALIKISSIFKTGPFPGSQENCSRLLSAGTTDCSTTGWGLGMRSLYHMAQSDTGGSGGQLQALKYTEANGPI